MKLIEQLKSKLTKIGARLDETCMAYTLNLDAPSGYVWRANGETCFCIHYATNSQTWLASELRYEEKNLRMGLEKVTDQNEIERFRYELDDDNWGASPEAPERIAWPA